MSHRLAVLFAIPLLVIAAMAAGRSHHPRSAPRTPASASALVTTMLPLYSGLLLELRIGEQRPATGPIAGDILFLHGFADRLDNHGPLFDEWNRAGFRVISFDLPSHGETRGYMGVDDLDSFSFENLSDLAIQVTRATAEDPNRPLLIAGWSTGGLLAVRMLQTGAFNGESRQPSGAILFAPGVSVRLLVGTAGIVTEASLTSNPHPPHVGSISPRSPLLYPIFATTLLLNARRSRKDSLPQGLPVLTVVGGDDEDHYVLTPDVRAWVNDQRTRAGAAISGIVCDHAMHELDNEPDPTGTEVRGAAAAFATAVVTRGLTPTPSPATPCSRF